MIVACAIAFAENKAGLQGTMRILYAFQGTGNGHAARARAILPELSRYAQVDVATSGMNSQLNVGFPISHHYRGISYENNGQGRISYIKTVRAFSFVRAIRDIRSVPLTSYDCVVNDFEPITAYAALRAGVPSLALSHQAAFLSRGSPRPKNKDYLAEGVFKWYAPASAAIGFHFERYDSNIITPLLRSEIHDAKVSNEGHMTVYLPGFDDQYLANILRCVAPKNVHIFSRKVSSIVQRDNVTILPVAHDTFVRSLLSCDGFLAGAGFEGPAEALHLGKKLMVVPLGGQYEQWCNAAALAKLRVPNLTRVTHRESERIREWFNSPEKVELRFPCVMAEVVGRVMAFVNRHR